MVSAPGEMALRGRIGGLALAASADPREYTRLARKAFMSRFEREVDPNATLPSHERRRRAEAAKKAHFARMALRSAKVRRQRSQRRQAVTG